MDSLSESGHPVKEEVASTSSAVILDSQEPTPDTSTTTTAMDDKKNDENTTMIQEESSNTSGNDENTATLQPSTVATEAKAEEPISSSSSSEPTVKVSSPTEESTTTTTNIDTTSTTTNEPEQVQAPPDTTSQEHLQPPSSPPITPRIDKSPIDPITDEETAFLLARLQSANQVLERDSKTLTFDTLQAKFEHAKTEQRKSLDLRREADNIDWEFWGKIMTSYEDVVRKNPRGLTRAIKNGIPEAIRGMVWQLISKSTHPDLEDAYRNLLSRSSPFEKLITRDLSRTFPNHEYFQQGAKGQTDLFHVMKAYSLYDPEVGYCQGLTFVVGPLLLNMPDEEAFCVLVRLMKEYSMRGFYTPKMEGLQLRLYQFDKLLQEHLPAIFKHLNKEGIRSSMYASQWFLTLFAYRFPLPIVFRILDILFAEGLEVIFRFSIALLKKNQDAILSMEFEQLIDYLKHGLFETYSENVTMLIEDAYNVRIIKRRLDKLEKDWEDEKFKLSDEYMELEELRKENRALLGQIKDLRDAYQSLSDDSRKLHTSWGTVVQERDTLQEVVDSLERQVKDFKSIFYVEKRSAAMEVANEMKELENKNFHLATKNFELEERVVELERALVETKLQLAQVELEKAEMKSRWDTLRRTLE